MSLQTTGSAGFDHLDLSHALDGSHAEDGAMAASGHAARVVQIADSLAQHVGLSAAQRVSLRWASLLHDVGKMGIPGSILTKTGPLNAAERELMNRHPQIGYEVLQGLDVAEDVRQWVYQHHERWDGRGYPNGLTEDEVALPCRVLVISEVYDALVEVRSYKAAWSIPRIINFFRSEAGGQFDPDLAHTVADGLQAKGARFFTSKSPCMSGPVEVAAFVH